MSNQAATTNIPLADQLAATAQHLDSVLPAEAGRTIDAGIEVVTASGLADNARRAGEQAPGFTLPNATGNPVTLSQVLARGPVVLTFFRGNWCPYCDVQLRAYQTTLVDNPYGATLVAVSPQTPTYTQRTADEKELQFAVLSDVGNRVARQYGLVYAVGESVYGTLGAVGIDLEAHNGDASGELPLTATFVIGTDGVIAWAQANANFKHRPEPVAILNALAQLRRKD